MYDYILALACTIAQVFRVPRRLWGERGCHAYDQVTDGS